MIILGITHVASWNPAACLIVDGRLVSFTEEERFVRIKHAPAMFPVMAINFCLSQAGLTVADIDVVAVGFGRKLTTTLIDQKLYDSLASQLESKLSELGIERQRVKYFSHHLSHVASTFPVSGYRPGNIISVDGSGEDCAGVIGYYDDFFRDFDSTLTVQALAVNLCRIVPSTHSWGELWSDVTEILGFYRHSGEGKTMGLAPYGNEDEGALPSLFDDNLCPDNEAYKAYFRNQGYQVERVYQQAPKRSVEPLSQHGKNMARTLQGYYNRFLLKQASDLAAATGSHRFSITGGVGLNCSGNGFLAQQPLVEEIHTQPAAHDAGTALGAAVLAYWQETGKPLAGRFDHAYWGASFSDEQIVAACRAAGVSYQLVDGPQCAAELLLRNQVIGWFQGAAEVGPRALGNRSILANPMHLANLDRVNAIKGREAWRPLSPSIMEEAYEQIVDCRHPSPFMLLAVPVRDSWRARIPAVVHVDGSCRPQTVSQHTNPPYHALIAAFAQGGGVPVVLNTSFNLSHEPIVNSPADAIKTFLQSQLDALIMGNVLVTRAA